MRLAECYESNGGGMIVIRPLAATPQALLRPDVCTFIEPLIGLTEILAEAFESKCPSVLACLHLRICHIHVDASSP